MSHPRVELFHSSIIILSESIVTIFFYGVYNTYTFVDEVITEITL